MSIQGKTLGIIGMGRIGQATARRAVLGFGMKAIYFNRSADGPFDFPAEARASIDEVMAEADVVSLHAPGGGANRGLISAERIAADEADRLPREHRPRRRGRRARADRGARRRPDRRRRARRLRRRSRRCRRS